MDTITSFATGTDELSFDDITGITATSGIDISASAAKISDAIDGSVYVFADASSGTGGESISTFAVDVANGITADTILTDVAAFLDAGLGASDGENYVVLINDLTNNNKQTYTYLVNADADGIDADNISLIGIITEANGAALVAGDIS